MTRAVRVKPVAQFAVYWGKRAALPCLDFGQDRLVAIARYHSVSEPSGPIRRFVKPNIVVAPPVFERQVAFLAARYRCVTMDQVVEALEGGRALPRNAAVITFDDGYRDNHEHAYPILRKHGVPAIFYVAAEPLDGGVPLWTSEIRYLVHATNRPLLAHPVTGAALDVGSPTAREAAIRALAVTLVQVPRAARQAALVELRQAAAADPRPLRRLMLTWAQVREMRRGGMQFGSHTVSHPLLPAMPADEARDEIAGSRAELAARLRDPILHFSYPNPGDGVHCTAAVRRLVADAGYTSAVTSGQGYVGRHDDRFALARLTVAGRRWTIAWDLERDALRQAIIRLPFGAPAAGGDAEEAALDAGDVALQDQRARLATVLDAMRAGRERSFAHALGEHVETLRLLRRTFQTASS
jgi:peptidoglycan/xylan/chitin deacetylase (PgdA/CDA1 family)